MKKIQYLIAFLVAVALAGGLSGCATGHAAKAPTPIPVIVMGEPQQPIHIVVDQNGQPKALYENGQDTPTKAPAKFGATRPVTAPVTGSASAGSVSAPNPTVTATPAVENPVQSPALLSAPATPTAPASAVADSAAVDLSKESLQAGKVTVPNGSVILRKTVVTNIVSIPVPVRREEYEVVHVPVQAGQPASAFENKEVRMDLSKEVPTGKVTSELVDRVELKKVVKTDQPVVSGQVRTENAEVVPTPAPKQ